MLYELALATFITVTTPDGVVVELNVEKIVTLRPPREHEKRSTHEKTGCVVFTSDTKFVAVVETCDEIRQMIIKKLK